MTDVVHIEPADDQRRAFARWALSQTPKLQTSSSTGTDVPVDLYPSVPAELLEGAFVDGFRYGAEDVRQVPAGDAGKAASVSGDTGPTQGPQEAPQRARKTPRKRASRRPRKAADPKPADETTDTETVTGPDSMSSTGE